MADLPKFRTQAQWQSRNPILGSGEPGFDEDTGKVKIGDGHTHWNDLPYRDDLAPYTLPQSIETFGVSPEAIETGLPSRLSDSALKAMFILSVGTSSVPITNAATTRPETTGIVYWLCAHGVTPTNAAAGDLIWNAAS
jgi:hypothetical protein